MLGVDQRIGAFYCTRMLLQKMKLQLFCNVKVLLSWLLRFQKINNSFFLFCFWELGYYYDPLHNKSKPISTNKHQNAISDRTYQPKVSSEIRCISQTNEFHAISDTNLQKASPNSNPSGRKKNPPVERCFFNVFNQTLNYQRTRRCRRRQHTLLSSFVFFC